MSKMPLLTIIVPVYNTEKYLKQCLSSLCSQTYGNIEILVVDDGSNDSSAAICDEFAEKDPRVVVIHKDNGGVAMARNVALSKAKGDYFMFVDSDDWVVPDFCECALSQLLENNVRLLVFGHKGVYEVPGKAPVIKIFKVKNPIRMTASQAMRYVLGGNTVYNYMCNKIYDRKLFDGIEFPVGRVFEDNDVTYRVVHRAGDIFISDKVLYYYRRQETSISYHWNKPKSIKDRFQIWRQRLEFLKVHYPEHVDLQIVRLAYEGLSAYTFCKGDEYKDFRNEVKDFLKENKACVLKNSKSVFFLLYYYCRPLLPACLKHHHNKIR